MPRGPRRTAPSVPARIIFLNLSLGLAQDDGRLRHRQKLRPRLNGLRVLPTPSSMGGKRLLICARRPPSCREIPAKRPLLALSGAPLGFCPTPRRGRRAAGTSEADHAQASSPRLLKAPLSRPSGEGGPSAPLSYSAPTSQAGTARTGAPAPRSRARAKLALPSSLRYRKTSG